MKKTSHKTISVNQSDIFDYIQNNQQAFIDSFIKPYLQAIMPTVELKIKDAISTYYKSYRPLLYQRQYSLNGIYKIDMVGGKVFFDSSLIGGVHRADDEYIYDVMFKKGYHGGAPHNGNYYWRFPSPQLASEIGVQPYIAWYPFGPAVQTESPFSIMSNDIYNYVNTYGVKLLASLIQKEVKNIMKGV